MQEGTIPKQVKSSQCFLRYLWVYSAADDWTRTWHQRLVAQRKERGYDIEGFCVTPPSIGNRWFPFHELDRRWRLGDPGLISMYGELAERLADRDVLILYNGANLHPEFVSWLKVVKVYTAGDDPESTEILTRPIAPAFDIHLVNNVACVDMYRDWGLKRVYFWPLGSLTIRQDVADLDEEKILDIHTRPLSIVFVGDRNRIRKKRLDRLVNTFSDSFCAGRGWPRGVVDWSKMWATYKQAQVGWNLHNSTGPINFRLYDLPAHGVMQICDNKKYLSQVYELDKEVVGFDTIDECIELTRYYLSHPEKQRDIALAGWKRWRRDYTPERVWDKLTEIVESHSAEFSLPVVEDVTMVKSKLLEHTQVGSLRRQALQIYSSFLDRGARIRHRLLG